MSAPASRRSILQGLAVLPAISTVPAAAHAIANPDLLRLVEECERTSKAVDDAKDLDIPRADWNRLCRANSDARTAVALAPVACRADIRLKLRALRTVPEVWEDIRALVEDDCRAWCFGTTLALAIAGDLAWLEARST